MQKSKNYVQKSKNAVPATKNNFPAHYQNHQDYYTDEDYDDVMSKLPEIIKQAERRAGEVLEPTIVEKKEIMNIIRDFVRNRQRKVYGGTALDETIKLVNPADAIYDDYKFSDIEFYSPTPVPDLVELTNLLYDKKYKHVTALEAQHEETYSIFVNIQLYCDITYVPQRVYNGIKTIVIDGIHYAHPHFMLIDYFRMINQPLTAAAQRWEKAFVRMYKLLKNYPLELFNKQINLPKPDADIQSILNQIKNQFMSIPEIQNQCLIAGFDAYNFYIKHAMRDRSVEQMARSAYTSNKLDNLSTNVPYYEFISVDYRKTVEKLYDFIRKNVANPQDITLEEYYPLFQYTGYSILINYRGQPIVKITDADGFCVPCVKTTKGYMYVSYQYLLMLMLIGKFGAHLDKNKEMYFNYGYALSNLVKARNIFLNKMNLGVINNTVFGEFKVSCVGSTISYMRESKLRSLERYKRGKTPFRYSPEQFYGQTPEQQSKFDPTKYNFKNTSGNKINNPKNLFFKLDNNGDIIQETIRPDTEENIEPSRVILPPSSPIPNFDESNLIEM